MQKAGLLVSLPKPILNLVPGFLLVSCEYGHDIRFNLNLLKRVAPDFGLVEVQQSGFGKELQIGITRAGFSIDPGKIDWKGFLRQQLQHLFSALLGGFISTELFRGEA